MNHDQQTPGGLGGLAGAIGIRPQAAPPEIVLKAGTIIKVGGFPFRLMQDTPVEGHAGNLALNAAMLQQVSPQR